MKFTMANVNAKKKKYTAVSTFSGCGGSSLGYKMAGFKMLWANEFIPAAQDTYEANHIGTYLDKRDIRKVKPEEILKKIGLKKGELDLFDGSPPCHTEDTLVFTKRGYVEIKGVVKDDLVLTHRNRWKKVTGTTKRKYTGPMIKLTTMNAEPVHCTPAHGFYVVNGNKKQWKKACDLTTDDYVKIPRDMLGAPSLPDYSGISIGQGFNRTTREFTSTIQVSELNAFFDREEFWWIVGRFLGDGWVHDYRKKCKKHELRRPSGLPKKAVIVCCNPHNDEAKDIVGVLDKLGWKYKLRVRRTSTRISLLGTGVYGSKTELADFFKQFGRFCHGKRLPDFVYLLSSNLKKALVEGYVSADGRDILTKYGSDAVGYTSVSRELLYGITRLINDSYGVCSGRIKVKKSGTWNIEGRSGLTLPSFGVRVTTNGVGAPLGYITHEGDLWVRVRKTEVYSFSGYVYNLHVKDHESYTANNLASHNCSAFSTAGARDKGWGTVKKYSDSKQRVDDLFYEYIRILKGLQPKVFVAENVPGLASGKAKGYFVEIFRLLQGAGYVVEARILDASQLGVPQARKRLIFVGVRKDLKMKPVFPQPLSRVISVNDVCPNIAYIKTKKDGQMKYVPANIPSPTITASDSTNSETAQFSCGGFIETQDGEQRKYKISELKKIFTFPPDFELTGKFEQKWERLGRSVPPMFMYHVAKTIGKEILDKL